MKSALKKIRSVQVSGAASQMWHKDSYWGLRKIRKHRPRLLDRKGRRIRFRKGLEIDKKYQWIGFVGNIFTPETMVFTMKLFGVSRVSG